LKIWVSRTLLRCSLLWKVARQIPPVLTFKHYAEHFPFNGLLTPTSILLDDQAGVEMQWNKCRHFRRYCSLRTIS
jgi:hypothetical protein